MTIQLVDSQVDGCLDIARWYDLRFSGTADASDRQVAESFLVFVVSGEHGDDSSLRALARAQAQDIARVCVIAQAVAEYAFGLYLAGIENPCLLRRINSLSQWALSASAE